MLWWGKQYEQSEKWCCEKKIKHEQLALFTHCYSHSLNFAPNDTIKRCQTMEKILQTRHEITKLRKYFPWKEGLFYNIKGKLALRVLAFMSFSQQDGQSMCDLMMSVINNYSVLQWSFFSGKVDPCNPINSDASECVFSTMHCIKSYLWSTMTQERLNHLMTLHVHKERTYSLSLPNVYSKWVC